MVKHWDDMRGCRHCGMVHRVPHLAEGEGYYEGSDRLTIRSVSKRVEARCVRCGAVLWRTDWGKGNQVCAALALAGLICYPLGVSLPVVRLEQLGHVHEASVWSGSISLLVHGRFLTGVVVLFCSVIIPLLKLVGLLVLSRWPSLLHRHHQARVYRWIELAGRWGMIDVLLVALLIAALKLGDLVTVTPGPGVTAFAACVVLSLLASACFDPHSIWDQR